MASPPLKHPRQHLPGQHHGRLQIDPNRRSDCLWVDSGYRVDCLNARVASQHIHRSVRCFDLLDEVFHDSRIGQIGDVERSAYFVSQVGELPAGTGRHHHLRAGRRIGPGQGRPDSSRPSGHQHPCPI